MFFLLILASVGWAFVSFAPWVPTKKSDLKRILRLSDLKPDDTFYELGCGDGRVCQYINRQTKARTIGIELAFPWYLLCLIRKMLNQGKGLHFKLSSFFYINLSEASVVYIFGLPHTLGNKLTDKLKRELRPGTKIISYSFALPGLEPSLIDKPGKNYISIYVYNL